MATTLEFFADAPDCAVDVDPATSPALYGERLTQCVACGGAHIAHWNSKRYQYTEGHHRESFQIDRCVDCGSGFLNPPPHPRWLQAIYRFSGQALSAPVTLAEIEAREQRCPNSTVDAARMARLADRFNRSGKRLGLDIGSGFGFYTRALRRAGYRTVSINPGQYENAVFREMNGDEPLPMLLDEFQSDERFGVIVMSQVLEHLLEADAALAKTVAMLEPGGVFACSVPNFKSIAVKLLGTGDNACLWVPEHVSYFSETGLRQLLERHGLRIVHAEQVTRVSLDNVARRFGMAGACGVFLGRVFGWLQRPLAALCNALGMGIYLHVYAVKGD